MVEQSLVIRRVSRLHSGRYSCTAINTEGTGLSNTVQLRVMCKWQHPIKFNRLSFIDRLSNCRSADLPAQSEISLRGGQTGGGRRPMPNRRHSAGK